MVSGLAAPVYMMDNIKECPHNKEGGFWHMDAFAEQMWLDGLYMAGPICAEYAFRFNKPEYMDTAIKQALLMQEETLDTNTGLWYHAWDSSGQAEWADPITGYSGDALSDGCLLQYLMSWTSIFMLRMGVALKDNHIIDDALNQYYWHIEYLQDKSTSLWYHGYNNIEKSHMSGFYWGRANAWAAYTMSQVNKVPLQPYLYPQFMDVECVLRDQLAALKGVQTENGLWRTVLNDEESYEELSASCGIAAAMMVSKNPLHTEYLQKAYQEITANITNDGRLLNVSGGGTAVMRDLDGYRNFCSTSWKLGVKRIPV